MIKNLGTVLSVLARAAASEIKFHDDVTLNHAPPECHELVYRGSAKRMRVARRRAEALAEKPMRVIIREARQRGGLVPIDTDPRWNQFVYNLAQE